MSIVATAKKKQVVTREMVWTDPSVIHTLYKNTDNHVEYGVYNSKKISDDYVRENLKEILNSCGGTYSNTGYSTTPFSEKGGVPAVGACFANLMRSCIKEQKEHDRIFYYMVGKTSTNDLILKPMLSEEECSRWIRLCKLHNMLPDYVDEGSVKFIENEEEYKGKEVFISKKSAKTNYSAYTYLHGLLFVDISKISPSLTYMYLSNYRMMREHPGFVRTVIYLVDELSMDFFAAYLFGSALAMSAPGHHVISTTKHFFRISSILRRDGSKFYVDAKKYINFINGVVVGEDRLKVNLLRIRQLRAYCENPEKHDARIILRKPNSYFSCLSTIDKIKVVKTRFSAPTLVSLPQLLTKKAVKLIYAPNEEMGKLWSDFAELESKVKYEVPEMPKEFKSLKKKGVIIK